MQWQRRAWVLQRRAFAFATAAGATTLACYHLETRKRPLQQELTVPTVSSALSSLRTDGAAVVTGMVDLRLLSAIKATDAYKSMPTRVVRRREQAPPEWRQSAFGRFHRRQEALEEGDVRAIEQVERAIWPLVRAFFEEHDEDMEGIFRSEMQVACVLSLDV